MTIVLPNTLDDKLLAAQANAALLFKETEQRGLIKAGISEKELNDKIYELAYELFGIRKYWHKRIVRAGINTLCPYRENPPDLIMQENDLVFFDFGPVFEEWEADFGRTYLLGTDPLKQKMIADLEIVFNESKQFYEGNRDIAGNELYNDVVERSKKYGWLYGGPHAGHLIGIFPHEMGLGECPENYICPENSKAMRDPDKHGNPRNWILEIHLINKERQYGAFYEQLLTLG